MWLILNSLAQQVLILPQQVLWYNILKVFDPLQFLSKTLKLLLFLFTGWAENSNIYI